MANKNLILNHFLGVGNPQAPDMMIQANAMRVFLQFRWCNLNHKWEQSSFIWGRQDGICSSDIFSFHNMNFVGSIGARNFCSEITHKNSQSGILFHAKSHSFKIPFLIFSRQSVLHFRFIRSGCVGCFLFLRFFCGGSFVLILRVLSLIKTFFTYFKIPRRRGLKV